jgi:uncharacterized protein (DUF885 family)
MAKTLDDIKREFFEQQIGFDPVEGFYLGLPGHESQVRIPDDSLRSEQRRYFTRLLAELETYPLELLTLADRIDVRIMRTDALWSLLRIEEPEPLGWRSSADISHLVHIVYHNVERQKGRPAEWDAILARMEKLPALLVSQQRDLERGLREKLPFYKKEVQRDGIDLAPVVREYFQRDVPAAAEKSMSKADFANYKGKLASSARAIAKALETFSGFLKKSVLPVAKNEAFAIGEEEYAWRLANLLFSDETPESLFKYGTRRVEETEKEMQKVADQIRKKRGLPSKPFGEVVADLGKEAPGTDKEMFEMYRSVVERTVKFLRAKRLFRLPADYAIGLTETPAAYHNTLSVAAMNPVPPFLDGFPAQFWITPTRDAKHPDGNPELLRQNHAFSAAPNLVVHEAVPGHDLQLGFSARRFIAGGRTDLSYEMRLFMPDSMSSMGIEGWAHYAEQLMAEQGFYTPEEHLFQLKDAQWRNVRIVVDVGIHTGRMKYDEAVKYFDSKTFSGGVTAEREIYRYSKWPLQAITYNLGKRDILNLRKEVESRVGSKRFDPVRFHELLLSYDGVPVALFRQDLISRLDTRLTPLPPEEREKRKRRKR